jgi:hypothetical protein
MYPVRSHGARIVSWRRVPDVRPISEVTCYPQRRNEETTKFHKKQRRIGSISFHSFSLRFQRRFDRFHANQRCLASEILTDVDRYRTLRCLARQ